MRIAEYEVRDGGQLTLWFQSETVDFTVTLNGADAKRFADTTRNIRQDMADGANKHVVVGQ